jgi:lysophospholipase L1-like esterase
MGELEVARCIASRDISCFVMDYDYNSPSAETLKATHEAFFREIRAAKPELPVVFVTHPYYSDPTEKDLARVAVVKETYENALANGDKNVYFVDSSAFFSDEMRDLYAVDYLHPNDLGQFSMAKTIYPTVKKAITK